MVQIVDSHCHLDRLKLEKLDKPELDTVIAEAVDAGVSHMLCVGIDEDNAETVKQIAKTYPNVFASVGVHPLDAKSCISATKLKSLADDAKVVAIGETGLDNYYSTDTAAIQKESFALHLEVAKELSLPSIVHTRDAKQDTLDIIKAHACTEHAGVLHCFTEDWAMAKAALDMGFYISFSGIVTFKNAKELQEVAKQVPLDRILVETDSPYLTPVPFRGRPNYPKFTRQVAECIADLRGESLSVVATHTTDNFFRLFNKAKP